MAEVKTDRANVKVTKDGVKVKVYPCGLRLVVNHMPGFKSVATSIYVGVGSRDELSNEFGLSHFVEHMLFKGTKTRSSSEIANILSGLGVDYNAYTSLNATCYHTRGLASNLDACCDILSDMYFNLKFSDEDFTREAEVIVQEIAMREDIPRLVLGELCAETFFAGTAYGHNIAGSVESVRGFSPQDIYNYMYKHYTAPKTIISFSGDVTFEQAEKMISKYFLPHFTSVAEPVEREIKELELQPERQIVTKQKNTEQHNVAILFPAMNCYHSDKYIMTFVHGILSSDMSSRLFNSVRDKLGLVYSISGGLSLTHIGGYYYVHFSCTPKNTELVLKTIAAEIKKIKADGVSAEEISKVKNIKLADKLFESENVEALNQRIASLVSEYNEIESVEEYLEKINAVTQAQIKDAVVKYLRGDNVILAAVGNNIKKSSLSVFFDNL